MVADQVEGQVTLTDMASGRTRPASKHVVALVAKASGALEAGEKSRAAANKSKAAKAAEKVCPHLSLPERFTFYVAAKRDL